MSRLKIFSGFGTWLLGCASISVSKFSGRSSDLVIGNYNGYMSPEIINDFSSKYKFVIDHFDHDQNVKDKFRLGIYDSAVVSTSILQEMRDNGLLKTIDWSKLLGEEVKNDSYKDKFSDSVKAIMNSDSSLWNYGIPYFLNKLSFCYVGEPISSLQTKVKWSHLLKTIVSEERFKSRDGTPRLAMIDDPRTIFSLSRFANDKLNINPDVSEYRNSNSIYRSYFQINKLGLNSQAMGSNFLFIDPISSNLVDALSEQIVSGAFMYNGDCLFAASGGNAQIQHQPNKFHIVEMERDIYFLDFFVISNKITNENLENLYSFLKELIFTGKDENSSARKNFEFILYTPVIKEILEYATSEFFQSNDSLKEVKKKILEINVPSQKLKSLYESSVGEKFKSDMLIAYEKFKLNV